MNLSEQIQDLRDSGELAIVEREVDRGLDMARVIHALGDRAVLFEKVAGSDTPAAANLCARRAYVSRALGVPAHRLLHALCDALENPAEPPIVGRAPCQQVIEPQVDLNQLPILTHRERDGGAYVTAGALIARDPELGVRADIHRLQQLDARRLVARLVDDSGTYAAWQRAQDLMFTPQSNFS